MRALEKDPAARFQTVGDFARALDACLAEVAAAARWSAAELDAPTMSGTVVNAEPLARAPFAETRARSVPQPARHRCCGRLPRSGRGRGRPTSLPVRWRWLRSQALLVLGLPRLLAEPEVAAVVPSVPSTVADAVERATAPVEQAAAIPAGTVPAPQTTAAAAVPSPSPAPVAMPWPLPSLAIIRLPAEDGAAAVSGNRFQPGERIRLRVTTSQDAHVYCYLQDESRRIVRFYPNRFSPSALVKTAAPLEIPGPMRFELVANTRKVTETVACFASEQDLLVKLPAAVVGTDFKTLPVASLDQLKGAFARTAGGTLAQASFEVQFK